MRLVIAALSAPTQLNGVSRHAANLVRALLASHHPPEIHLLAGAWQTDMYARAIASSSPRLHIHPILIPHRSLARVRWYYQQLPQIANRLGADVVHLGYTMPLAASPFACPTIVTLHDLYPFDIPRNFGWLKAAVNRELMHHCLRNVDAIACVSESTRARLWKRFGAGLGRKAITVLNVVEPMPASQGRRPPALTGDQPFLLCVAQHRPNKNLPLALRIFARLLRDGLCPQHTRLLIVGIPGPDSPLVHSRIRQLGLERNVLLLSGITDAELQWCYRHCQLLLAPSRIEGFGLPVAEALLAGCPIVCSDIDAFREIGGARCSYVPLGENIVERYVHAARQTLPEPRPSPLVLPHLSPEVVARQYIALYANLLASRRIARGELLFYADSKGEDFDPAEAR